MLQLLKQQGRITIPEMVERFRLLGSDGPQGSGADGSEYPVIRTIGGAMYDGMNTVRELPFAEKEGLSFLEKERIARAGCFFNYERGRDRFIRRYDQLFNCEDAKVPRRHNGSDECG